MAKPIVPILVIHEPGRKRANLAILLGSMAPGGEIQMADCAEDALAWLWGDRPILVLIGSPLPKPEMEGVIGEIQRRNPKARVLLMLSNPQEHNPYAETQEYGILYDGFSPGELKEILSQF